MISESTETPADISDMESDTTRKRTLEQGVSGGPSPDLKRCSSSPNVSKMMSWRSKSGSIDLEELAQPRRTSVICLQMSQPYICNQEKIQRHNI